jgi:hypothetical protein
MSLETLICILARGAQPVLIWLNGARHAPIMRNLRVSDEPVQSGTIMETRLASLLLLLPRRYPLT